MSNPRGVKIKYSLPYGRQWIDEEDITEVEKVLRGDWITQGSKVEEFEKKIAEYCKVKYAVAVSSGTAALESAYFVAGIREGDEIITSPLTFSATSYPIMALGAKPVFADIDPETLNIDASLIEKVITSKTKAIVPIDFSGQPCQYDEIRKIARKHNFLIIEDAAHSLGSEYKGKKVGSLADMTILSFHPVKLITTGEGGMALTNNKDFYEKLKIYRSHGIVKNKNKGNWYYEIENPGHNFRITDFQCALGISQLRKINKFIKRRREIVEMYNRAFKDIDEVIIPYEAKNIKSAWHIYVVQLKLERLKTGRKRIFDELKKEGLRVQVHYMPLHLQPFYKKKYGAERRFPMAERYYERCLTLPLFPKMTNENVEYVIEKVKKVIAFYRK